MIPDDARRFLDAIFPDHAAHAVFANADAATKHWKQFRKVESLDGRLDCYLSIAAFPNDGRATRQGRATEVRCLVVDDVGSSVPAADVERALGRPTAKVRTSAESSHWWYRLATPLPVADWDAFFAEVRRRIGVERLDGPEAVHVFRLPMGVNTKPERNGFEPQLEDIDAAARLDTGGIMLFAEPAPGRHAKAARTVEQHDEAAMMGLAEILPNPDETWNDRKAWVDRAHQFWVLAEDKTEGFAAFKLWSKKHPSYDEAKTEEMWDSIHDATGTKGFLLLRDAEKADPEAYAQAVRVREKAKAAFADDAGLDAALAAAAIHFEVDQEKSSIAVVEWLAGRLKQVGRGDWREFNEETGRWREWTGDHMLRVVLELVKERKQKPLDPEVAKKLGSVKFIENIARAAALHRSVAARVTDFDRDPLLLGVPSGVIDLRRGKSREVRKGRAAEMVSKAMWVDPAPAGTAHPQWSRFLGEFTQNDAALEEWLQVRAGYCLTGLMDEYIMPFYHGSGGNGKSVYLNALRSVWGEYGAQIEHRLLFEKQGGYHLAPLAVLAGVRLAVVTDVPAGASWDVHIMKMLTGDDAITANRMHQNPITFKSTAKVDVSGNGEPTVRDMDEGIRRRLKLIPLTATPREIDKQLSRKLAAEWPAILAWALVGLDMYWRLGGLPASKTVDDATNAYHAILDPFQRWLDEVPTKDGAKEAKVSAPDLFRSWDAFRASEGRHGMPPSSVRVLIRKMEDKGFVFAVLDGYKQLRGYKLSKSDASEVF